MLALKEYKGGVLIISHNKEFCDGVATEKWIMNKGSLRIEGESKAVENEEGDTATAAPEEVVDGFGNKIKVNKHLSEAEKKKEIKLLEKKLKEGKKKGTLSQEEEWEMQDKFLELNDSLAK